MIARKSNAVQTRAAFFYQSSWYVFVDRRRVKLFDGTPDERATWKTGKRMSDGVFSMRPEVSQALLEMESLQSVKDGKTETVPVRVLGELFMQAKSETVCPDLFRCYKNYVTDFCSTARFGNRDAMSIRAKDVRAWLKDRNFGSQNTVAAALKAIKSVFNWASDEDQEFIPASPIAGMKLPKTTKRIRTVSDNDYTAVSKACRRRQTREFVVALFNTGRRPIEIARLVRGDVLLQNGEPVGVQTTKHKNFKATGLPEYFPFNATMKTLVADILKRPGNATDALFVRPSGGHWLRDNWVSSFKVLRRRTGLKLTAYWFRHEFITRSLTAGVPVATVAQMCGNSLEVIQKFYDQTAHLGKAHFADAIQRATASIPTAV